MVMTLAKGEKALFRPARKSGSAAGGCGVTTWRCFPGNWGCDRAFPRARPIPHRGTIGPEETSPGCPRPGDHAAAPDEAGNRSPLLMPRCGAPDFPSKLVTRIIMNLLTILTGLGIQFIICLNYLVSLSPNSPFLGLLLPGSGKAIKRLCHRGQRNLDLKNEIFG